MKNLSAILFCILLTILHFSLASSEISPRGKISSISADGTITVNTGLDIGFESGDILVIQRNGLKIGLAHIAKVTHNTSMATVIETEPGTAPKVGDAVAYQLLDEYVAANWPEPWKYGARKLPNIMREEWKAPTLVTINLDKVIDDQYKILNRQPYNRTAMLKLADAYFKKSWYEHAVRWSQRAVEADPAAEDNDKLLYQIIRCLGFLNEPEKQALYISFLNQHYPNSVFAAMELDLNPISGGSLLAFRRGRQTITDLDGFQKSGMQYNERDRYERIGAPRLRYNYYDHYDRYGYDGGIGLISIGGKLLQGRPSRIRPQTYEPTYYEELEKSYPYCRYGVCKTAQEIQVLKYP